MGHFKQCMATVYPKAADMLVKVNEIKAKGYDECYKAIENFIKDIPELTDEQKHK